MKPEQLADKLEHQIYLGSYDWTRVDKLMLDAARKLRRLAAENKALSKDAERYRWLRHGDNDEPCLKFTQESRAGTNDAWLLRGHELDVAIDAAMQKETP